MLNKIEKINLAEMEAFVAEAKRMITEYGWEDRMVYPYNFPVPVGKIIRDLESFDNCTKGSQYYLIDLANGFANILNAWEAYENAPKTKVRIIQTGEIREIDDDLAIMLCAEGKCIIID